MGQSISIGPTSKLVPQNLSIKHRKIEKLHEKCPFPHFWCPPHTDTQTQTQTQTQTETHTLTHKLNIDRIRKFRNPPPEIVLVNLLIPRSSANVNAH